MALPITSVVAVAARLTSTACAGSDEAGAHPRPLTDREPGDGRIDVLVPG
jgi:hypothetical protein